MNIFDYFRNKGIDTLDPTFYRQIEVWRSWYNSKVRKFHKYKVYRGNGTSVSCTRYSLGMAKKVCEDMADLLLNEKVTITIADHATDTFVKQVLKDNIFEELGNEYQERKAALGTVAYVVYIKDATVDEAGNMTGGSVGLNYVEAAHIYPTSWQNKVITECIFTFPKTYKRKKYIHLQYHRLEDILGENRKQYVIENNVVENTSGAGTELTPEQWEEIPAFSGLAECIETGSEQPLFIIDRLNMVNNADEDTTNPMGVALFANAIDIVRKLDLEYDSYANEFSLGRKRIFVAPEFLTTQGGDAVFDPQDTVFYELPEDYFRDTKEAMHEVNMELRIEEHSKAINDDLNWLSFKCGFGTNRYKFENGQVKTATEVISENSDMYRTLQKHELVLERVLIQLIQTIIRAGISIGISGLQENTEINIKFDDSIIQDKETERQNDRQDVAMGALGIDEYRVKWMGETLDEARKNLPEQFDDGGDGGVIH
ncbi:MAG: phage portal protein [Oscillospiraceae bacterium]|nr:phage portal protein [Oscillospiraceae bacterium]